MKYDVVTIGVNVKVVFPHDAVLEEYTDATAEIDCNCICSFADIDLIMQSSQSNVDTGNSQFGSLQQRCSHYLPMPFEPGCLD